MINFFKRQFNKPHNNPWKPVILYFIFGILWIYFSDRILHFFIQDPNLYSLIQTFKGIFYVVITAILLYLLIHFDAKNVYNMALYDQLTGSRNRNSFESDIETYIIKKKPFHEFIIDINEFRVVNEVFGHAYGDELLKQFASTLNSLSGYNLYRWWADQFILIYTGDNSIEESISLIKETVNREFNIIGIHHKCTVSVSILQYPKDGQDLITLNQHLEMTSKKVKELGKNATLIFNQSIVDEANYYADFDKDLKQALADHSISIFTQPVYSIESKETDKYEVLIRWIREDNKYANIGKVIQAAEKTKQIKTIDRYVIHSVFNKISSSPILQRKHFAINLSAASFTSKEIIQYLINQAEHYQIQNSNITLEITEHSIVDNYAITKENMTLLKSKGFNIALDDFGIMYSSLTYISRLPFDILKIDKSFIDDLLTNSKTVSIVELIIALGNKLDLSLVAEGIETKEQEDALLQLGCTLGQGFHYSKPFPIENIS